MHDAEVKLDEVDLGRYWRFALPAAVAGFVVSGAVVMADLTLSELPDAVAGLYLVLFLGLVPVHLGTVLTYRRLGIEVSPRDHSVLYWIVRSVLSGAVFLALLRWRVLWGGRDREWMLAAITGLFYVVGVATGLRYRRTVRTSGPAGPAAGPAVVASTSPPGPAPLSWSTSVQPPPSGAPPWSMPTEPPSDGARRWTTWPPLTWPRTDGPAPPGRRSEPSPWRFLPVLVTAVATFAFIATRPHRDSIVGPTDRPFYVATVIGMERPDFGYADLERLAEPPEDVWAAVCRNYRDFLDDVTLEADIVIIDDPWLVRSAELLDGAYAGDQVALDAETFLVQGQGSRSLALERMRDEDWPSADIAHAQRYYQDRAAPPSAAALNRYVVFMASRTTTAGVVARLAVDPEGELISKPTLNHIGDISVRLPDGSSVAVSDSRCWK